MYPTYDDARARERELLQSARMQMIAPSGPRRERHSLFRLNASKFLTTLRKRYVARVPAVGRPA
jgi:hypothetical protein